MCYSYHLCTEIFSEMMNELNIRSFKKWFLHSSENFLVIILKLLFNNPTGELFYNPKRHTKLTLTIYNIDK